jgi:hypothetical protein
MAANSIDILDSVEFMLNHNDAMQDVAAALQAVNQAIAFHTPLNTLKPMQVYELPVCYRSTNARTTAFNLYFERNPQIQNQFTQAEWDEEVAAYGIVANAVCRVNQRKSFIYIGVMPNPVFSHSFTFKLYGDDSPEARAAHYARDVEWHEFILLLDNRKAHSPSPLVTF